MGAGFPPGAKNDRNCHGQIFGSWAVLDAAVLLVELERRLSALRGNVTPAFLSEWWDTPASQNCQHARPKENTYARRARHRQKACAALSRAPLSLSRLRKVRGSVPSRGPAEWLSAPRETA